MVPFDCDQSQLPRSSLHVSANLVDASKRHEEQRWSPYSELASAAERPSQRPPPSGRVHISRTLTNQVLRMRVANRPNRSSESVRTSLTQSLYRSLASQNLEPAGNDDSSPGSLSRIRATSVGLWRIRNS